MWPMASLAAVRWIGVRVVVGAGAVGMVLGVAQVVVYGLVMAYSGLTPYAGP